MDDYYLHSKENKCVSCGEAGHYLRYRVVPACYRRNFPVQWKSHRSHDIVLLCVDCHHVAHKAAEAVKRQLSQEYHVPLFPPKVKPEAVGGKVSEAHPYNVRRAAVALKHHGQTLPEDRRRELQQMVRGFVRQDDGREDDDRWLSQEELEQGLLAGLAPRQKRRMLRQLAAEKDEAVKAEDSTQTPVDDDLHLSDTQEDTRADDVSDQMAAAQHGSSASDLYAMQHDTTSNTCDMVQHNGQSAQTLDGDDRCQSVPQADSTHSSDDHRAGTSIQQLSRQRQGGSRPGVSDEDTNGHAWHGRQVVAAAMAEGGSDALLILIQRFRQSFTDALHPKFLPSAWNIMNRYVGCMPLYMCMLADCPVAQTNVCLLLLGSNTLTAYEQVLHAVACVTSWFQTGACLCARQTNSQSSFLLCCGAVLIEILGSTLSMLPQALHSIN